MRTQPQAYCSATYDCILTCWLLDENKIHKLHAVHRLKTFMKISYAFSITIFGISYSILYWTMIMIIFSIFTLSPNFKKDYVMLTWVQFGFHQFVKKKKKKIGFLFWYIRVLCWLMANEWRPCWFSVFQEIWTKTVYLIKHHLMIIYVQLGVSPSEKWIVPTFMSVSFKKNLKIPKG